MLLIIAHHYVVNSGLMDYIYGEPISLNSIFLSLFGAWGKIGINCFVLLTGYFMYKKSISLKKFLKLLLEVLFYNFIISSIFFICGYNIVSAQDIFKSFFIIDEVSQNFVGCFLLFYLLIPFLNILIKNLDKTKNLILIIIVLFIYSILGSISKIFISFNYVSWFCIMYIIGAYLSKYIAEKKKINWTLFLCMSIMFSMASVVFGLILSHRVNRPLLYDFVVDSNKILPVITSVCLFMKFKSMKFKYNKYINYVSSSIFGVLLIHANCSAMRQFLWNDVLKNTAMFNSKFLVLHAIFSVICIFVICIIIDKIRIKFIEKPFFKLFNNKINEIDKKIEKYIS